MCPCLRPFRHAGGGRGDGQSTRAERARRPLQHFRRLGPGAAGRQDHEPDRHRPARARHQRTGSRPPGEWQQQQHHHPRLERERSRLVGLPSLGERSARIHLRRRSADVREPQPYRHPTGRGSTRPPRYALRFRRGRRYDPHHPQSSRSDEVRCGDVHRCGRHQPCCECVVHGGRIAEHTDFRHRGVAHECQLQGCGRLHQRLQRRGLQRAAAARPGGPGQPAHQRLPHAIAAGHRFGALDLFPRRPAVARDSGDRRHFRLSTPGRPLERILAAKRGAIVYRRGLHPPRPGPSNRRSELAHAVGGCGLRHGDIIDVLCQKPRSERL